MKPHMYLALPAIWVACAIAGYLYAQEQHIPLSQAWAAIPAFLLEVAFYYALGVEKVRTRLERYPPVWVAVGLVFAAVIPYCVASLALGSFRSLTLAIIAGMAAVVAFWYILLPHKPAFDL